MNSTWTTCFVIPSVIIVPWLFLTTPGSQARVSPLYEKSLSNARHPVESTTIVDYNQDSNSQDLVLELLDPQGFPIKTTSIDLNVIIESQETTRSQAGTSRVSSCTYCIQENYYIPNQGHIAIPSKTVSQHAKYKDTILHLSIADKERQLGSYHSIPWPQELPSQLITIQLNPLCRIHGTVSSSDLSKLGCPLDGIQISSSSTNAFYSSYRTTASDFELLLPPGHQRIHVSGQSKTAKTEPIKQTIHIEPGQREMDIGTIDLPADYLTSKLGQPAPELAAIQAWITG